MTDDEPTDVCALCARDLDDDGRCPAHGDGNDWRKLGEERRAETIRDRQQNDDQ